jgi:hypothetical protein
MVLSAAEVWRWLLLLLSPLLSVGVLVAARTVQGMARVRSGQAPAWPLFLTGVSAVPQG